MKLTPAMYQYMENKALYPDCVIMFRMGDFYEMFYDDAKIASKELGITLTSRGQGESKAPLAGIPYHALNNYLSKFVQKGYKIAICEQLEDPKLAKGIVKRGVVRIVTPGTLIEDNALDKSTNNYITSLFTDHDNFGISICDVSTGDLYTTELDSLNKVIDLLTKYAPKEILLPSFLLENDLDQFCRQNKIFINKQNDQNFFLKHASTSILTHFNIANLNSFNINEKDLAICSTGALLEYLKQTQMTSLTHIQKIKFINTTDYMVLDSSTLRNLEITRNIIDHSSEGTLIEVLDKTTTPMGSRKLKLWITHPITDPNKINERLELVEFLTTDFILTEELKSLLDSVFDLERLLSKIVYKTANARDLNTIKTSLNLISKITELLTPTKKFDFLTSLKIPQDLILEIDKTLKEEVPLTVREGNMIKQSINPELDLLREIRTNSKNILKEIEEKEIAKTGIPSLRIRYTHIFGYFIEVTNKYKDKVPLDYIRKQTLVNNERFITEELKQLEERILTSEEKIVTIEFEIFMQLLEKVSKHITSIQNLADAIATLDCLISFSLVSKQNNYVRPKITTDFNLKLIESRHPVIEQTQSPYIPNDFHIIEENRIMIITGPNMSGKCLVGDTIVFTNQGLRTLNELRPRKIKESEFKAFKIRVKGRTKKENTSHFYYDGKKKTIKIRTKFGFGVEGTYNHPILIRTKDGEELWKKLGEVRKGDIAVIDRNINFFGNKTSVEHNIIKICNDLKGNTLKKYKLPTKLNLGLAYFIGILVGEGSLKTNDSVRFTSKNKQIINAVTKIAWANFRCRLKTVNNKKGAHYLNSKQIRVYLYHLGLDYVTTLKKEIPCILLKSTKDILRSFLRGLFDADGTADNKYGNVSLSTSAPKLAKQVQMVLLNFGIVSSIRKKPTKINLNYTINIDGAEAIKYYNMIGFTVKFKKNRSRLISQSRHPNYGIPCLSKLLKRIQERIVLKKGKKLSLKKAKKISSIFYTYIPNQRNISYSKLKELIDYCNLNKISVPELKEIYKNYYLYMPITKITNSKKLKDVYDFTVPISHSFVANGFINHNSSCLRQVALSVLMAQIGCFVPAREAEIGIVDKIFTRIGAYDDLSKGRSTFMVEMNETANILNNSTKASLILLDELGRGTSTYDGISIAWAVCEYLTQTIGAKTLFATHYHQLNKLSERYKGIKNYNILVKELDNNILFLHKLSEGGTDKSYGIHVAKLAGVPDEVIKRSQMIITRLETEDRVSDFIYRGSIKDNKPLTKFFEK